MTFLLAFLCCLLAGLLIARAREYRKLKRQVLSLSARLVRQDKMLARLSESVVQLSDDQLIDDQEAEQPGTEVRGAEAAEIEPAAAGPAIAGSPGTEVREAEAAEIEPATAGPATAGPATAGPARRRLGPGWSTFAAILVLGLGAGFLVWFGLTLDRFSPALRFGTAILAGLTSLTLGLLAWEKYPNLGLAAEGCGLALLGLALAALAREPAWLAPGPARAALVGLGLFGAILALRQNSTRLAVLVPTAFFGLWSALGLDLTGLIPAAAGFFYLALGLAAGRSNPPARRLALDLGLAAFNLALVGRLFDSPLPWGLSPWAGLSLAWTLESVVLFHCGRRRLGALGLALAALAVPLIPDRFSGVPVSQFFLAAAALGGALVHAASRPGRADLKPALLTLGLGAWLAGALATAWGLVTVYQAESAFILNWLLTVGSLFSLGLWLAGRAAPDLLMGRRPGRPAILVLAQALPLVPALALALGFLWSFLRADFAIGPEELDPAAWGFWILAQVLGLSQARRFTPVGAWSNAFLLILTLVLVQGAAALFQASPDFGRDMARLAALLGVLALCVRPPRLAIFQDFSLCRAAGQVLSCLALWRGLTLALDPADRPGFFGFLPVINLTNLAQAAAFWLPVAFLRRLAAPDRLPAIDFLQGLLFFIWLNVVLARAVHHLAGVPYRFETLFGSAVFWAFFAGIWGTLALGLWLAGRRRDEVLDPE